MPSLGSRGARDLRAVSRDLQAAAGPRGLRAELRRNIVAAVQPMKKQVQRNAFNIPAKGPDHTGLRVRIMRAVTIKIRFTARTTLVRLWVDPAKMPDGEKKLPVYMEGEKKWNHPVYGPHDSETWVNGQPAHPYFAPAIPAHLPGVNAGVVAAVDTTAAKLSKGI